MAGHTPDLTEEHLNLEITDEQSGVFAAGLRALLLIFYNFKAH
jgi:hypothetical protein